MLKGNTVHVRCSDGDVDIPSGMISGWDIFSQTSDDTLTLDCKIDELTKLVEYCLLIKGDMCRLPKDVILYARKYGVHAILRYIRKYMFKYVSERHPLPKAYRETMFDRPNIEEVKLSISELINRPTMNEIYDVLRTLHFIKTDDVRDELFSHTIELLVSKDDNYELFQCKASIIDDTITLENNFNSVFLMKALIQGKHYLKRTHKFILPSEAPSSEKLRSRNNFQPFLLMVADNLTNTNAVDSTGRKCILKKNTIDYTKYGLLVGYENGDTKYINWDTIESYSFDPDISSPVISYQGRN